MTASTPVIARVPSEQRQTKQSSLLKVEVHFACNGCEETLVMTDHFACYGYDATLVMTIKKGGGEGGAALSGYWLKPLLKEKGRSVN